jgi:hypothetical protein
MATRVKLEIRIQNKKIQQIALVKSGYETREPEILLPQSIAFGKLNLKASHPQDYYTASGKGTFTLMEQKAKVRVLARGKKSKMVEAKVVSSPYVYEATISDALAGELGIVLLDLKSGKWRLKDDPPHIERDSL